ncbi:MAG: hypothetical protein J6T00_02630 [Bacteroidaceae bacterium]|nr:hypothetical protein [Bacteroidaceae bacterium]
MKKNFFYATMSAIALTSAIGFTACSSDDAATDVNPTYDGNSVKTQFTISFPENVAETRMTTATVQKENAIANFRGMENIVLYPFAATGAVNTDPVTSSLLKIGDAISLKSMVKPTDGTVDNSIPAYTTTGTGLTAGSNSVLYNDVTIPVGTGSFLFYGKAIDNATYTDKFYNGSLSIKNTSTATPQAVPNPENIAFELDQIYPTGTTTSTVGAALATYLTQIAQAGGFNSETKESAWEASDNTGLKELYTNFKSLKAGSSLTVQAVVQALYTTIKNNTDEVSVAIKNAILNADYATDNDGTLEFKSIIGNSAATYFPGDVNLPDGAAILTYNDDTNTFSQNIEGGFTSSLYTKYADLVYPASLYYYCNSGVKTSNSSQQSLYDGTKTWGQITGNEAYNANAVGTSTRSVAIIDPIQYAVGRMDMQVTKLPAATLYDRKGNAYDASNGFTVTGVLIGGQKQVGFDFKTNASATEKTIYDNITKSQPATTMNVTASAASPLNYTLALETVKDVEVYVAVEFVNNGADFEGADGVIPAGCKFYLVGKLTPSSGTGYDADTMNQVFKQDYITTANFSITQGTFEATNNQGLGAAHNTIPDLRTPQLELGLSVDLTWQSGLSFNVEF